MNVVSAVANHEEFPDFGQENVKKLALDVGVPESNMVTSIHHIDAWREEGVLLILMDEQQEKEFRDIFPDESGIIVEDYAAMIKSIEDEADNLYKKAKDDLEVADAYDVRYQTQELKELMARSSYNSSSFSN